MDQYDSTQDTQQHIEQVAGYLRTIADALLNRAQHHDASKLREPEKSIFDQQTPKLKALQYGSHEYYDNLKLLQGALQHHYEQNLHHPEHYREGVAGMTLIDLVEMFCDWCAATYRHEQGNIFGSIESNQGRFNLGINLACILANTAAQLKIGKGADHP